MRNNFSKFLFLKCLLYQPTFHFEKAKRKHTTEAGIVTLTDVDATLSTSCVCFIHLCFCDVISFPFMRFEVSLFIVNKVCLIKHPRTRHLIRFYTVGINVFSVKMAVSELILKKTQNYVFVQMVIQIE